MVIFSPCFCYYQSCISHLLVVSTTSAEACLSLYSIPNFRLAVPHRSNRAITGGGCYWCHCWYKAPKERNKTEFTLWHFIEHVCCRHFYAHTHVRVRKYLSSYLISFQCRLKSYTINITDLFHHIFYNRGNKTNECENIVGNKMELNWIRKEW